MHLDPLIKDLAVILVVAAIMTFFFRKIKQPVVLGYLLAGMIVGPYTPPVQLVTDVKSINTLAELGVIFLMFTLGLEFSFRKLIQVGFSAFITATAEVVFFLSAGYAVGRAIGWTPTESLFLGAMLSISSTTIIIKALDEMNLKKHRFAQVIFGVLIVEDLYAILLLVGLATIVQEHTLSIMTLSFSTLKLLIVIGGWFITGFFLVPRLIKHANKVISPEMTTIISIALCLALVYVANEFGYSSALGAFMMGSILAETSLIHEIEERMAPLRDLFGVIFFVSIGMLINPTTLMDHMGLVLILSLFTVAGKVFSTTLGSLASGQPTSLSLQVGMGLAQIGEFSFIIAGLGTTLKAINTDIYPIIVAVSSITTFTTPYFIKASVPLGKKLDKKLPLRLRDLLHRYDLWIEHNKTQLRRFEYKGQMILRWFISGFTMTIIFLMSHYFTKDLIKDYGMLLFLIPLSLSLPFIWAMLFGHRRFLDPTKEEEKKRIPVLVSPLLTFSWIVVLSALFFPLHFVLPICALFLALFMGLTYKKLEVSYQWFESNFLDSFSHSKNEENEIFNHLAPWSVHLVGLKAHPNSIHVKKTLVEAQLRTRMGINIVAIRRGLLNLVAPGPQEMILPGDELIVLGTDDQIAKVREELENPFYGDLNTNLVGEYELRYLSLTEIQNLAGKTIRQSGLRENYHILIVGIERAGMRIINPDTDAVLLSEDKIWLVGGRKDIERMLKDLA